MNFFKCTDNHIDDDDKHGPNNCQCSRRAFRANCGQCCKFGQVRELQESSCCSLARHAHVNINKSIRQALAKWMARDQRRRWTEAQLTTEESNANKSVTIFPWNCSLTAWHTLHLPGPENSGQLFWMDAVLIASANSQLSAPLASAFLQKLSGSRLSDNSKKQPPPGCHSVRGSFLYRKVWRLVRSKNPRWPANGPGPLRPLPLPPGAGGRSVCVQEFTEFCMQLENVMELRRAWAKKCQDMCRQAGGILFRVLGSELAAPFSFHSRPFSFSFRNFSNNKQRAKRWRSLLFPILLPHKSKLVNDRSKNYGRTKVLTGQEVANSNIFNQSSRPKSDSNTANTNSQNSNSNSNSNIQQQHVLHILCVVRIPICPEPGPLTCGNAVLVLLFGSRSCNAYSMFSDRKTYGRTGGQTEGRMGGRADSLTGRSPRLWPPDDVAGHTRCCCCFWCCCYCCCRIFHIMRRRAMLPLIEFCPPAFPAPYFFDIFPRPLGAAVFFRFSPFSLSTLKRVKMFDFVRMSLTAVSAAGKVTETRFDTSSAIWWMVGGWIAVGKSI